MKQNTTSQLLTCGKGDELFDKRDSDKRRLKIENKETIFRIHVIV